MAIRRPEPTIDDAMRILLVGNFLSETTTANRQVCEELADRLEDEGLAVRRTSNRPGRWARLLDMRRAARRADYDVAQIDVFSGSAFRWAEAAVRWIRRADRPVVLTLHGGRLPEFAARHPRRVRRLLDAAAAVTVPSPFLADRLGALRPDMEVIPNALALERYPFREDGRDRARIVWIRTFDPLYGPDTAVRALAHLRRTHPRAVLHMSGPDPAGHAAGTLELARSLGIADAVHLHGPARKEQIPERLAAGDLFLNTSRADNAPVTVIEAQASGLPVVTSNVGGIPDLVQDGRDALLVPPDDPEAAAGALARLLDDAELAQRLAREGRRRAEALDWSVVLPRWIRLLESVAAKGRV